MSAVMMCLPTGAAATLLRSVAYFDGARSAGPWTVLGIWAGAGLLLTLTAHRPAGRPSPDPTTCAGTRDDSNVSPTKRQRLAVS